MTIPPVPFPASREISAGWRQLNPPPSASLWVGILWFHRVEAPVTVRAADPLAPLREALLGILSETAPTTPRHLQERLRLPDTLATPLLEDLRRERLIRKQDEGWLLTSRGVAVQQQELGPHEIPVRRTFCFAAPASPSLPRHLPFQVDVGVPAQPRQPWHFDPATVAACCAAEEAWKTLHRFPLDVTGLATEHKDLADWERVVVERAEIAALFMVSSDDWRGFAAEPRTWLLRGSQPVLRLANAVAEETLQDSLQPPALPAWRQAWTDWARSHGLAKPEADACELKMQDGTIQVASSLPRDRWRSFHRASEEWLLAGSGAFRCAAKLVLPA